jgi:hypothetical protein
LAAGAAAATGVALAGSGPAAATQSAPWEPLRIGDQGWYQSRETVSAGYFIENPNPDVGMANIELEATVREGGTVLKTTSEYIEWVAPGQRLGIGTDIFLSSGQRADDLSIAVKKQSYRPMQALSVEGVRVAIERGTITVSGTIRNPYPRRLESVAVTAVLYDGSGRIIGGDDTSVRSVPANGTADARISIFTEVIRPASAEMFAYLSIITEFGD